MIDAAPPLRVQALYVYPVKACAGVEVAEAHVERRGLSGDRRWMITEDDGAFVTQREEPRLCLVRTALGDARVTLRYDGASLEIPRALDSGKPTRVRIWKSDVDALELVAARAWVTRVLGRSGRLVYMPERTERGVTPDRGAPGDILSFADGFPVLLASTASLADLEQRVGTPVEITRFRPNVLVDGAPPFAEDAWARVAVGEVTFRAPKACDRCFVTTVDPATAAVGVEPLRTLATFRKWDKKVWFGLGMVPEALGTLRVGDPVQLLASR